MGNRRRSTCVIVDIFKTETQDPGTRSNKHFCPRITRIGTNRNPLFLIRVFPHISRLLEVWGFRINSDASLPGPIVISSLFALLLVYGTRPRREWRKKRSAGRRDAPCSGGVASGSKMEFYAELELAAFAECDRQVSEIRQRAAQFAGKRVNQRIERVAAGENIAVVRRNVFAIEYV